MIDVLNSALDAAAHASLAALPLLFTAGIMSSASPCVAARSVMLLSLVRQARHPRRVAAAYACGVVVAYTGISLAAGALTNRILTASGSALAFAAVLIAAGLWELRRPPSPCAETHEGGNGHPGVVFALGAVSAFVISPCCSPMMLVLGAAAARTTHLLPIAMALAAFAAGHALPLVFAGWLRGRTRLFAHPRLREGISTINGTVLVGFGIFYGIVA